MGSLEFVHDVPSDIDSVSYDEVDVESDDELDEISGLPLDDDEELTDEEFDAILAYFAENPISDDE